MDDREEHASADPTPRASRLPLARRFTIRYAIGLAMIAALLGWLFWDISRSLDTVAVASSQLEASATQTSRVHRVVELATTLEQAGGAGDLRGLAESSSRLNQEATALRHVQDALLFGDDEFGLPDPDLSPQLRELYFGSGRLDERLSGFASTSETLARFNTPADAQSWPGPLAALRDAEEDLTADLDQAMSIYSAQIDRAVAAQRNTLAAAAILAVLLLGGIVIALFRPMATKIQRETAQLEEAERRQREIGERQSFRNDLARALEVCDDELEVLDAMGRALDELLPDRRAEVLMTEENGSRLSVGVDHPRGGGPGCPVDRAEACAALRAGQTMVYESSRMLNVCPKLPQHSGGPCAAVCVPLMFNGRAVGVLHATGPENQAPRELRSERLKVLGTEGATRIGTIRITRATERLASSDVLTDLANRRTLMNEVAKLVAAGTPYSVAIADLDHFKDLNDTYGHEMGDRALQLFSACLRKQLRPEDVVARYGGEEFVIVLPETPIRAGAKAIERVQLALAEEITARSSVPFTASWGLTASDAGEGFEEVLRIADLALYEAKDAGRNCLVVDGAATARQDGITAATPGTQAPANQVHRGPVPATSPLQTDALDVAVTTPGDDGSPASDVPLADADPTS